MRASSILFRVDQVEGVLQLRSMMIGYYFLGLNQICRK